MSKLWLSIIKNNKYFFSILALILVFAAFLISDLVFTIYYPQMSGSSSFISPTERLSIYFSFFTTQTNYLVVIYLFFTLLAERLDKKFKVNFHLLLAITVYITVTMFVFWTGLIGDILEAGTQNYWSQAYAWIKTIVLHFIIPVIMIVYFVLISGKNQISYKTYYKLYIWLILVYPVLYLTAVMIRGDLRYQQGYRGSSCFPYFFLNYHQNGVLVFGLAIFLILIFILLLIHLYIWVNNFRFKQIANKKLLAQKEVAEVTNEQVLIEQKEPLTKTEKLKK
ncbi:Pr6Pr family membrane protein [Spiroplasma platyhelix]|uniref:Pr6Pr family membrane protein n=1 Tax=Spiroplasma platyhelix PALS-1 TaxID=1276218 RepID=A0A846U0I4_9MOLU|nr:Pr6Pr family membrane protein [Spiroplasma platyhelix]MBE4704163.1 hypothetical protein [Spiroplasma platyhelix PALS-1]NKE38534.1 Pr6Pr family membrane protein [Spiroplasma platyhelix PALS-1]UJB29421.1 hypothetical protein SPLAT_v1c06570 [Spiroplasma platyhelix PALS-1]